MGKFGEMLSFQRLSSASLMLKNCDEMEENTFRDGQIFADEVGCNAEN